jgi:signal transduction histidine kinase
VSTTRLHLRLQFAAFVASSVSFAFLVLLLPAVLRLEPELATAAVAENLWTWPLTLCLGALATWLRARAFGAALTHLERGEGEDADVALVERLHALPLRWALSLALLAVAVTSLTMIPALRPSLVDADTQIAVVLLSATVTTATSLPLYVVARGAVGRALESVPWRTALAAMHQSDDSSILGLGFRTTQRRFRLRAPQLARVRSRLLYAVALPVAIVALGAALLVDAHQRAFAARARRDDAYTLARSVLELEGSAGGAGRTQAIAAAEERGYAIALVSADDDKATAAAPLNIEGGARVLRAKLDEGSALIRFSPSGASSPVGAYLLAATLVVGIAALVGRNLGRAVATDLRTATREVRLLGMQDVMRGATRVAGPARFDEIAEIALGVEQVAERFREFAQGRERVIEARESAQRMRELFLASMSHDLRSPLNGILGFVALLQKSPMSDGQRESLAIIERRGRELLELIENILDAARIEAGRLELSREWVASEELLGQAVRRGQEMAEEKARTSGADIEVVGEASPDIGRLWIDEQRLLQAMVNLVGNAVKFMDRGEVRVRLVSEPRGQLPGLRIEVRDQGRGIPEKELAQIFDAFRQPLRSRRHGGLGLGLTMARAVTELHGGTIDVASSPETGSTFSLWIPLISPETGEIARAPTPPPALRRVPSRPPPEPLHVSKPQEEQEFPTVEMPALELGEADEILEPKSTGRLALRTPRPPPLRTDRPPRR